MGDKSAIEWTDATWNPLTGCTRVSAGCDNCYAAGQAAGRLKNHPAYDGLAVITPSGRAAFNGRIRLLPERLDQPLRWRKPRRIFVNSMSDLFHPDVDEEFIHAVFAVMAATPQHTYQVLTKRPERAAEILSQPGIAGAVAAETGAGCAYEAGAPFIRPDELAERWPLPNVWLGTSVEDQAAADERIPHLLRAPAAVRFLSCEPLLGPVDLEAAVWPQCVSTPAEHYQEHGGGLYCDERFVDWVIVGGESGPCARPMHPQWARRIRDQCVEAGVPFHFKQWGEYSWRRGESYHNSIATTAGLQAERVGKKTAGRKLDGRTWDEYPGGAG